MKREYIESKEHDESLTHAEVGKLQCPDCGIDMDLQSETLYSCPKHNTYKVIVYLDKKNGIKNPKLVKI